jgi:hypothetical protein
MHGLVFPSMVKNAAGLSRSAKRRKSKLNPSA